MKLALRCSQSIQKVLSEILAARDIVVVDDAPFSLVDRAFPAPDKGIAVLFDAANLDEVLQFVDELRQEGALRSESDTVVGKRKDAYEIIKLDDVFFFQGEDNDTYCRTRCQRYEIKKKLYELESGLYEKGFIRVSKSYLVNILMVREIVPWFGGRLLLKFKDLDAQVEVSRKHVQAFKNFIDM
jgi:DNA-binding LytR/AlgR family response regulator